AGFLRATDGIIASERLSSGFFALLANDLNTPAAIAKLHEFLHAGELAELKAALALLGLASVDQADWVNESRRFNSVGNSPEFATSLNDLAERWQQLREQKEFVAADQLKALAEAAGVKLRATVGGAEVEVGANFDPAKLEALK
ncbi:MAG: hypothetical protein ACNA7L_11575, partial [Roseinatronobacter sp.]